MPVHAPTKEEWESRRHPRIDLTSDNLTWDPSCSRYEDQEEALLDHRGEFNPPEIDTSMRGPKLVINSLTSQILLEDFDTSMRGPKLVINSLTSHLPLAAITHNDNFATVLQSKVNVSATHSGGVRSNAKKSVDAPTLARRWMIPEHRARQTVQQTTQCAILLIPLCLAVTLLMTVGIAIHGCHTWHLLTLCLLALVPNEATSVHSYLPPTLDGHVHIL